MLSMHRLNHFADVMTKTHTKKKPTTKPKQNKIWTWKSVLEILIYFFICLHFLYFP